MTAKTAKLNRRLFLVIPIEQGKGTLYAHAAPISREQFEQYFMVLAKTFAVLYKEGLGAMAGPRVAAMLLRKTAADMGMLEDVETGLLTDIRRLANVIAPTDKGWQQIPLEDAAKNNVIDAEDVGEVENAICFFTLGWHMHTRAEREAILTSAAAIWNAQVTSSSCTEYLASLATSTTGDGTTSKTG